MKIFESKATYKLSVILTEEERSYYFEAFQSGKPVAIPELDNKLFQVYDFGGYYWEGAPQNSYCLEVRQVFQLSDAIERDKLLKLWGVSFHSR